MVTPTGWSTVAAVLVLSATAAFTGYPQLVLLAVVAASLLLCALLLTRRPKIEMECSWPDSPLVEETDIRLQFRVTSLSRRAAGPIAVAQRIGSVNWETTIPGVSQRKPYEGSEIVRELPRGAHRAQPVQADRLDPFGLVRHRSQLPDDTQLLVFPRTTDVSVPGVEHGSVSEGRTSEFSRRGGNTFHSLREYSPGDEARLIHWPTSARTGTLMVRTTVVPDILRHVIVLDTDANSYGYGQFDEAVRICASLVRAANRDHQVWLVTHPGGVTRAERRGSGSSSPLMDQLAAVDVVARSPGPARLPALPDLSASVVTVVCGERHPPADGGRPNDRRWAPLREAVLLNVVRVCAGPDSTERDPSGGIRICVPDLTEFSRRWNSRWKR